MSNNETPDFGMYSEQGNADVAAAIEAFLAEHDAADSTDPDEWVIAAVSAISGDVDHPEVGDTVVREAIFEAVESALTPEPLVTDRPTVPGGDVVTTDDTRTQCAAALASEFGELVGRRITGVRLLTEAECDDLAWDCSPWDLPFALLLDNGVAAVVSQDPEGNGPGFLLLADVAPRGGA